jgi:hypothetical protein
MIVMRIGDNSGQVPAINIPEAQRVIKEFEDVATTLRQADNISDSVDLDPASGSVRVDFSDLGINGRVKYTGTVTFDPASEKGFKDLFVTRNYDKPGGVGINYAFHNPDGNTLYYRRDEMYQEYPMCRYIQEVEVDKKTGEITNYNAWEERDDPFLFGGESDAYEYRTYENR